MASRQGAASREACAAGAAWRGQTGALSVLVALSHANLVQCGLLCLMLQPYTLFGTRRL